MISMKAEIDIMLPEDESSNWDNFFKKNPHKVLGEVVPIKTIYKKDFTRVKGNIEELKKIELPNYHTVLDSDFSISEIKKTPTVNDISQDEILTLKQNNKKSKKEILDTIIRVNKNTTDGLWSFDEVDKTYNVGISDDEKTAYVYYLENILGKKVMRNIQFLKTYKTLKF